MKRSDHGSGPPHHVTSTAEPTPSTTRGGSTRSGQYEETTAAAEWGSTEYAAAFSRRARRTAKPASTPYTPHRRAFSNTLGMPASGKRNLNVNHPAARVVQSQMWATSRARVRAHMRHRQSSGQYTRSGMQRATACVLHKAPCATHLTASAERATRTGCLFSSNTSRARASVFAVST